MVNLKFLFERHKFANTTVPGQISEGSVLDGVYHRAQQAPSSIDGCIALRCQAALVPQGASCAHRGKLQVSVTFSQNPCVSSRASEEYLILMKKALLLRQRKAGTTIQYLNSTKSLLNVTATAVAARALAEQGKELKPFQGLEKENKYNFKY